MLISLYSLLGLVYCDTSLLYCLFVLLAVTVTSVSFSGTKLLTCFFLCPHDPPLQLMHSTITVSYDFCWFKSFSFLLLLFIIFLLLVLLLLLLLLCHGMPDIFLLIFIP